MKVEMKRSRLYGDVTLEAGRVVDVEQAFGKWLIHKGFAVPYSGPVTIPNMREMVKRGRPTKGN